MTQTIHDLMHKGVLTCPPSTSLGQVAALLDEHQVHALIVAEYPDQPLGVISDFDLLAGEWLSVDEESLNTMRFPVTIAVRPLENSCMIVTRRRFSRTSRVTDRLIVPWRTISRMFFPSTSFAVRPETRRYALLQKRVSALPLVM